LKYNFSYMIKDAHLKLKNLRTIYNKTPKQMADVLGISDRAYSYLEAGQTEFTVKRINEICEIFKIDAMDFLGFDHKQVFNNCQQEGNIGINYIQVPDKLVDQYERRIANLEDTIILLKQMLSQQSKKD